MESGRWLIHWGLMLLALACWHSASAQTTVRYVHTDALGSVVAITDEDRNVVERREYEPYGAQLTPVMRDGPGYTGHVQDAATGLVHMQQRYYDPQLGIFLSVDPVTPYGGDYRHFNRYAYAYNNPYKFNDPDGRLPILAPAVAVGVRCATNAGCRAAVGAGARQAGRGARQATRWIGAAAMGALGAREGMRQANETAESGNTNPYAGPVDAPVVVVDSDGNAIPVGEGEQVASSPDGRYQQVKDGTGQPTGTRLDKGGHKGHADPKAQAPHGHRPGVTDESGNPHLPIEPPKPSPEEPLR